MKEELFTINADEIDIEEIMKTIRTNIEKRNVPNITFSDEYESINNSCDEKEQLKASIDENIFKANQLWNINLYAPVTSNRRILGKLLEFFRKVTRRLLRWYMQFLFGQQIEFNASVVRTINSMNELINENAESRVKEIKELKQMVKVTGDETNIANRELKQLARDFSDEFERIKERIEQLDCELGSKIESMDKVSCECQEVTSLRAGILEFTGGVEADIQKLTAGIENDIQGLAARIERVGYIERELSIVNARLRRAERNLKENDIIIKEPTYIASPSEEIDMDYYLFEERYRGSEEEIDKRVGHYVPYFANKSNILDIGCGRGELLSRLLKSNISAKGIDLNLDMVLLCKDRGLPVEKAEALEYLGGLEDNSLGGIILLQVIEHLSPNQIIQLIRLSYQKLQHGAYFIAETINPQSLIVFTESYFMDLSHIRMIHPYTITFLMESEGFNGVSIDYLSEVTDLKIPKIEIENSSNLDDFNRSMSKLNDIMFGHRDYAIIGRK